MWVTGNLFAQLVFSWTCPFVSLSFSREKREGLATLEAGLIKYLCSPFVTPHGPNKCWETCFAICRFNSTLLDATTSTNIYTREEETTSRCFSFSFSSFLVLNFTFLYPRGKFNIRDSKLASCLIPVGLPILHLDCVSVSTMPYIVFEITVSILVFFFLKKY